MHISVAYQTLAIVDVGDDRVRRAGAAHDEPASGPADGPVAVLAPGDRPRVRREVWIVLGLSLGQAAVYSAISLVAKLTEPGRLRNQTATLNASVTPRELLDLTYQLVGIGFALVPVLLALHLLSGTRDDAAAAAYSGRGTYQRARRLIGLDLPNRKTVVHDLGWGAGLAAAIGIPGLGLYYLARALDINATVVPSALNDHWWTLPVLVLSAVQNAVLEEVVVVGYLLTRCRQLGVKPYVALAASAALRGGYHLYQGFGAFIGNAAMGVVFGTYFQRRFRVLPLVIAHGVIDMVAFIGYAILKNRLHLS